MSTLLNLMLLTALFGTLVTYLFALFIGCTLLVRWGNVQSMHFIHEASKPPQWQIDLAFTQAKAHSETPPLASEGTPDVH